MADADSDVAFSHLSDSARTGVDSLGADGTAISVDHIGGAGAP